MALSGVFTGARLAFSLRNLSGYTGPVIRVRRINDNAEADFTGAEILDGTLTTWTGANDAFVVTWYDQTGNGDHGTQSTTSLQHQIVDAGSVLVDADGLPNAVGASGNTYVIPAITVTRTNFTIYGVGKNNNPSGATVVSFISRGGTGTLAFSSQIRGTGGQFPGDAIWISPNGSTVLFRYTNTASSSNKKILCYVYDASLTGYNERYFYINNSLPTLSSNSSTNTSAYFNNTGTLNLFLNDGSFQEAIFWPDDKESDRADIYTEIYGYYFGQPVEPQDIEYQFEVESIEVDQDLTPNEVEPQDIIFEFEVEEPTVAQPQVIPVQPIEYGFEIEHPTVNQVQPVGFVDIEYQFEISTPNVVQAEVIIPVPSAPTAVDLDMPYRIRLGKTQDAANLVRNGQFNSSSDEWVLYGARHNTNPFGNGLNYIEANSNYAIIRQYGLFVEGETYVVKYLLRNNTSSNAAYAAVRLGKYGKDVNTTLGDAASDWDGEEFTEIRVCLENDYLEIKVKQECSITNIRAYQYFWNEPITELPEEILEMKYTVESDETLQGKHIKGLETMTFVSDGYDFIKAVKSAGGGEGYIPIRLEYRSVDADHYKPIFEGEIVVSESVEIFIDDCQESTRAITVSIQDTSAEAIISANRGMEIDMYGYDALDKFGLPQIWCIMDTGIEEIEGYTLYNALDYMVCYLTNARVKFQSVSFSTLTPVMETLLSEYSIGLFPVNRPDAGLYWFSTTFDEVFGQLVNRFAARMKFLKCNGVPVVKIENAEYDHILNTPPYHAESKYPVVWKSIEQITQYTERYRNDLLKVITSQNTKEPTDPINQKPNRYFVESEMYSREVALQNTFVFDKDNDQSYNENDLLFYLIKYTGRTVSGSEDPLSFEEYEAVFPNVLSYDISALEFWKFLIRKDYDLFTLDKSTKPPTKLFMVTGQENLITMCDIETNDFCESDIEQILSQSGWNALNLDPNFRKADTDNGIGFWEVDTSWVALNGLAIGQYQDSQDNIIHQFVDGIIAGAFYHFEIVVEYADLFNSAFRVIWVDDIADEIGTGEIVGDTSSTYELNGKHQFTLEAPVGAVGIGIRVYSTGSGASAEIHISRLAFRPKYDSHVLDKMIRFDGFRYGTIEEMEVTLATGEAQITLRTKGQTP